MPPYLVNKAKALLVEPSSVGGVLPYWERRKAVSKEGVAITDSVGVLASANGPADKEEPAPVPALCTLAHHDDMMLF